MKFFVETIISCSLTCHIGRKYFIILENAIIIRLQLNRACIFHVLRFMLCAIIICSDCSFVKCPFVRKSVRVFVQRTIIYVNHAAHVSLVSINENDDDDDEQERRGYRYSRCRYATSFRAHGTATCMPALDVMNWRWRSGPMAMSSCGPVTSGVLATMVV